MQSYRFALAGNPNCGKTTLFNALTGARQYVGNWAGVTVEKKEGRLHFGGHTLFIVDLPGIYSLSPYSMEEIVSKDYIVQEKPDVVINIVDASNIERNLFLTLQLLSLGQPCVVALNMMDVARSKGFEIDAALLAQELGVPVLPIVASKGEGIKEVLQASLGAAAFPMPLAKPMQAFYNSLESRTEGLGEDEKQEMQTDLIYEKISQLLAMTLRRPSEVKRSFSDRLDDILTHRFLGLPIFGLFMFLTFFFTFDIAGNVLKEGLEQLISGQVVPLAESLLTLIEASDWLRSLVIDGIIAGVGGVLVFIPNVACLFLMISLMEDTGYMARVAFIMDRLMRSIGLNGKAFIPLVLGLGCNVPAIMSTRTMEDPKDRLTSILINPFVSCSARLPVYTLFAAAFFPGKEKYVVFSLYLLGIFMAIGIGFLFKKTIFKAEDVPFIMEMPPYRFPTLKNLFLHVWDRVKGFIVRAGTLIFGAAVFLWFLQHYGPGGAVAIDQSFAAMLGRLFAPLLVPLGFGTWQAALALLTGVVAKEVIITNMAIVYGVAETSGDFARSLSGLFTPVSAYAFMVFILLYTPCIGVIAVIRRETNSLAWTVFSVLYQLGIAWLMAFLVYTIGSLIF